MSSCGRPRPANQRPKNNKNHLHRKKGPGRGCYVHTHKFPLARREGLADATGVDKHATLILNANAEVHTSGLLQAAPGVQGRHETEPISRSARERTSLTAAVCPHLFLSSLGRRKSLEQDPPTSPWITLLASPAEGCGPSEVRSPTRGGARHIPTSHTNQRPCPRRTGARKSTRTSLRHPNTLPATAWRRVPRSQVSAYKPRHRRLPLARSQFSKFGGLVYRVVAIPVRELTAAILFVSLV